MVVAVGPKKRGGCKNLDLGSLLSGLPNLSFLMWNWGKAGASGYSVAKCLVFCPNLSPNVAARALALWLKDWAPDISFITWRKSQHWKRKKYSFILQIQVDLSFYVQNNMMSHHRWAWLKCAQRFLSQIGNFFEKCTALSNCDHFAQKSLGSNSNQPTNQPTTKRTNQPTNQQTDQPAN